MHRSSLPNRPPLSNQKLPESSPGPRGRILVFDPNHRRRSPEGEAWLQALQTAPLEPLLSRHRVSRLQVERFGRIATLPGVFMSFGVQAGRCDYTYEQLSSVVQAKLKPGEPGCSAGTIERVIRVLVSAGFLKRESRDRRLQKRAKWKGKTRAPDASLTRGASLIFAFPDKGVILAASEEKAKKVQAPGGSVQLPGAFVQAPGPAINDLNTKDFKNDLSTGGGEEATAETTRNTISSPRNHSNENSKAAQTLTTEWNLAAEVLGIRLWRQENDDDPDLIRTVGRLLAAGDSLERLLNRARGALNRGKYGAKGGRTLVDALSVPKGSWADEHEMAGDDPRLKSSIQHLRCVHSGHTWEPWKSSYPDTSGIYRCHEKRSCRCCGETEHRRLNHPCETEATRYRGAWPIPETLEHLWPSTEGVNTVATDDIRCTRCGAPPPPVRTIAQVGAENVSVPTPPKLVSLREKLPELLRAAGLR